MGRGARADERERGRPECATRKRVSFSKAGEFDAEVPRLFEIGSRPWATIATLQDLDGNGFRDYAVFHSGALWFKVNNGKHPRTGHADGPLGMIQRFELAPGTAQVSFGVSFDAPYLRTATERSIAMVVPKLGGPAVSRVCVHGAGGPVSGLRLVAVVVLAAAAGCQDPAVPKGGCRPWCRPRQQGIRSSHEEAGGATAPSTASATSSAHPPPVVTTLPPATRRPLFEIFPDTSVGTGIGERQAFPGRKSCAVDQGCPRRERSAPLVPCPDDLQVITVRDSGRTRAAPQPALQWPCGGQSSLHRPSTLRRAVAPAPPG